MLDNVEKEIEKRQQQESGLSSSLGNTLPKEWEKETKQLQVKWEQVQSKQTKSQLEESGYEDSRFMFEDGIVSFPSHLIAKDKDDSNDDSLFSFSFKDVHLEEQKKELMQRLNVFTNHVIKAPRASKRLPVFKDLAPN